MEELNSADLQEILDFLKDGLSEEGMKAAEELRKGKPKRAIRYLELVAEFCEEDSLKQVEWQEKDLIENDDDHHILQEDLVILDTAKRLLTLLRTA